MVVPEILTQILARIPQQAPFRFVDELLELSDEHACGAYRFRADEYFYAGHFPDEPITPGVILIETMAQLVLVPLAIYLAEGGDVAMRPGFSDAPHVGSANATSKDHPRVLPLFAEADQVEFYASVRPGQRVIARGERIYFRRQKLKCRVEMTFEDGTPVASAVLAGIAVQVTTAHAENSGRLQPARGKQ